MAKWRFVDSDDDGEVWMANPAVLNAYVDYESHDGRGVIVWRRLMVVTKAWVAAQLTEVRAGAGGPVYTMFAPMLVLPDASPVELRTMVNVAILAGGLDRFSRRVEEAV